MVAEEVECADAISSAAIIVFAGNRKWREVEEDEKNQLCVLLSLAGCTLTCTCNPMLCGGVAYISISWGPSIQLSRLPFGHLAGCDHGGCACDAR